ncbi:MAG: hypothetical protein ABUJ92_00100 [Desulfobacterales bacterium]
MSQTLQSVNTKELSIAEFSEFDIKLQGFKEKYIDVVYDLEDEDQEKQARSDRLTIGKVVSSLDSKHKELKAPLKAKTDLIDGERKRIKDDLLGVQDKIKSQLKAHEQKIVDHAEMLQDKVEAIRDHSVFGENHASTTQMTASELEVHLAEIKSHDVDDSYEHRKADATLARVDTIKVLEGLLVKRTKYEAEQAELERLRAEAAKREQVDRDNEMRLEGEERAKREAEEKEKAEAEEKEVRRVEYYESMIKHIRQCAHGFIGGKQQPLGILFYELESKIVIDDSWGEFETPAVLARDKAISDLNGIQERLKKKQDEEVQENQKQVEEIAQKAAMEERERIAEEQAKAAHKAKQIKEAEDAKKANLEHRAEVHGKAKQSFMDNGFTAPEASVIISLIKDGKIDGVVIQY